MYKIFLLFFPLLLLLSSCCSTKLIPGEDELKTKFGNKVFIWNSDSSYLLIVYKNEKTGLNNFSPLQFEIYSLQNDKIIHKHILPGGKVYWADDFIIKAEIQPGNITDDEKPEDFLYFYDVKTNQVIKR